MAKKTLTVNPEYEAKKNKVLEKYIRQSENMPMGPKGSMGPSGPGPKGPGGPKGMHAGMHASGKPRNVRDTILRIISYIRKDVPKICFVFVCVIITNIATLLGSYMLSPALNALVSDSLTGSQKLNRLVTCIIIMAVTYGLGIVASFLQQKIMVGISQNALANIRSDLYKKLEKLPVRYHDTNTTGELMSRFTNDVDTLGEMLNNTMIQLISSVITIVGTLVVMFALSWQLSLLVLITMPLLTMAGGAIAKRSRRYYKGQQAALGAVNSYIEETVTGQKVVKVFCHEDDAKEEFEILSDELRKNQINAQFFGGIMGPVMGNLSQVMFAIVSAAGGVLCILTNFNVGDLAVFTQNSRHFSRPINEVSMQVNVIFSALAGAERVFAVMDEEPERDSEEAVYEVYTADEMKEIAGCDELIDEIIEECRNKGKLLIHGTVELKNVTFGYVPEKTVLKNINVTAHPGEKIAFVGSTGAGKTTITNLINRFYDIEEGNILVDGTDVKEIKRDSLRKHMAMVLQDTHLFTGTVRENIRYGRLDATDEEVEQAAKTASAHSFIKRLENGYDTMLEGDGANLSQGQRQLINIARAAISKAPILILDEATSSVDTRTEKHIEHGMDRLMKNRTTFVIAHRLSTVRDSQKIIVLEHGEIVEQGTHEELLELKGRYHQLYTGAVELD